MGIRFMRNVTTNENKAVNSGATLGQGIRMTGFRTRNSVRVGTLPKRCQGEGGES